MRKFLRAIAALVLVTSPVTFPAIKVAYVKIRHHRRIMRGLRGLEPTLNNLIEEKKKFASPIQDVKWFYKQHLSAGMDYAFFCQMWMRDQYLLRNDLLVG